MIEVWYYDKNKQADKTYPNKLSEYEIADLIKNGLTTTPEENIAQYMSPWYSTYKDKKDAKENCPYSKKRGNVVIFKNIKKCYCFPTSIHLSKLRKEQLRTAHFSVYKDLLFC